MYRHLLTRSFQSCRVARHLFIAAVLVGFWPPASSWADAIALTAHTSIQGFALVEDTLRSGADAQAILANFTDASDGLGPVTLSRVGGGISDSMLGAALATTITSVVRPNEIHVSGSTRADAIAQIPAGSFITSSDAHATALAAFTASFTLLAPHLFDANLALDGTDRGRVSASAEATLADGTGADIFRRGFNGGGVLSDGTLSGILDPGTYTLSVSLFSGAFAAASERSTATDSESERSALDLGFALTPAATPEPASVLLLGTGLVALGGRTWNRRRRTK